MKNFRLEPGGNWNESIQESTQEARRLGLTGDAISYQWNRRYAIGAPPDRPGVIAILHPLSTDTFDSGAMAELVARRTGQRVYRLLTEEHWTLLAFARDDGEAPGSGPSDDDAPRGAPGPDGLPWRNDQVIDYFDPDGSWQLVGAS